MAELSIGYIAGLIAFGIFLAQMWVPTAIAFLLGGFLRDEETAASWSVAAKILHSSYWTTILRTDSVRTYAVRRPISIASLFIPTVALLTAVASIVTPLGLYEELGTGDKEVGNFSYIRDTSAYFYGTSPRGRYSFSRICFIYNIPGPCPFKNDTLIYEHTTLGEDWDYPNNLTTDVPPILRKVYSSGTDGIGTTVSNFFDIEWRQLTKKVDKSGLLNHGRPFAVNLFRQLDSLVLEDSVRLVEGLVVDTISGGIGFRNHTVPQPPDRNVTWEEDLLFIEPTTSCVDTNLTLDFDSSANSSSDLGNFRLTDQGGFVHLAHEVPNYNNDNPQTNPDLWGRAYKAAVLNNLASMVYLNVTNSQDNSTGTKLFRYVDSVLGKSFRVSVDRDTDYNAASFSREYGRYLFGSELGSYPNPFNVTRGEWFEPISQLCSGVGPDDTANITNIFVACGLVRGPPRRVDDGPQGIFEENSKWTTRLYSCATAVRATVKTVQFSTVTASNGVAPPADRHRGLNVLRVTNITAKYYSNEESYPLWGVEDTGRPLKDLAPIWGLVSPAYPAAGFPNITVLKNQWLYLVALANNSPYSPTLEYSGVHNLPGAEFPFVVANTVYGTGTYVTGISGNSWPLDLTGRSNMAVFTRWQELTLTSKGTAKAINLLWTDLAASAVVGTKGIMPSTSSSLFIRQHRQRQVEEEQQPVPVIHVWPVVRRIQYHYPYGIPALVLLVVLLALTAGALGAWWTKTSTVAKMRVQLQQLSAGRIFTAVLYPGESDFRMSPRQWSLANGPKTVKIFCGEGGGAKAIGVEEETVAAVEGVEEHEAMRNVKTPAAITVSSTEGKTDLEYVEEMVPMQLNPYGGEQHGGYIALDTDSCELHGQSI